MKKFAKMLASMLAIFTLVFAALPTSSAASATEVLKAVSEKGKEGINSVHVVGNVKAGLETDGVNSDLGMVNLEGQVSLLDPFAINVAADLVAYGSKHSFGLIVKDGMVYESQNGTWALTSEDASADIAEFQKMYQEALAKQVELTDAQLALAEKYMDFSETDDSYVFALKQDIDAAALWQDIEATVDIAKIKEEVVANYESQGAEWTEENQQMLDSMLSQAGVEAFLAAKPQITMAYDKASYLVKSIVFSAAVDVTEFYGQMMPSSTESSDEAAKPVQILNLAGELNFDKYGEAVEVATPEITETTSAE